MNTRILVTGASGFIGGHLVIGLADQGYSLTAVCGQNDCAREVSQKATCVHRVDLRDESATRELVVSSQPAAVIHAAALANTAQCEHEPVLAEQSNVTTTQNVVSSCCNKSLLNQTLIIHISTDLVFDGSSAPPGGFKEEDEPCPNSVYALTKRAGERVVLAKDCCGMVMRISLCYGRKLDNNTGFMGWLLDSLQTQKPLRLFEDEWRTPVFVQDVVLAAKAVIETHSPQSSRTAAQGSSRVLHVGGSERISRYDFGLRVADIAGYDRTLLLRSTRAQVPSPMPRARDVSLSVKRLQDYFGIRPRGVDDGLRAMFSCPGV